MQLEGKFIRIAHDPGDPQITSHCPFCGSGQVTGRSDGTIDCAFCGMNYIVRVQPAFPGMPQQPMGPGALTDIGPEMGPMGMGGAAGMDPMMGMEDGPPGEGMPEDFGEPGEEGPPGEEDEEGGPPFGDDEGDEGGEEESGPPPPKSKDKGKKKAARFDPEDLREDRHDRDDDDDDHGYDPWDPEEHEPEAERYGHEARRAYRTLAGDSLDEARYIRHLAVLHSGSDPRVLAQLRNESAQASAHVLSGSRIGLMTANSPDAEIRGGRRMHQWVYPVPGSMDWQPSTGGLEHRAHARRCADCGLEGRAYPGPQGGLQWRYARSTDYQGKPEREHGDLSECPGRAA